VTIDDVADRGLAHLPPSSTPEASSRPPRRAAEQDIIWLSTQDAARRLGVTPRTLYRFIDEGQLPAYRFGRVIRLQRNEVDDFIERCRIQPGSLEHLYPESVHAVGASGDE
jgi:excisionase family DNA binding protein